MSNFPARQSSNRLGFHYFPDTLHYRESDLDTWLPELQTLGASWLTLAAPSTRAVPEAFIRGLIAGGIEPVLHFHLPLDRAPAVPEMRLLFDTYARWGVRYAALFDRPNNRICWPAAAWAQSNLVERFLDNYLPLANAALSAGMEPIFSPLEPGGDYWDTAFLKAALQGIERRGEKALLDEMILGAYAWAGSRRLDWGAGGPERWPQARPYDTPANSEDQHGFRIFEWYLAIARTVIEPAGIILLAAGARPGDCICDEDPTGTGCHARRSLALTQLVVDGGDVQDPDYGELLEPIPDSVLACNLWLLGASAGTAAAQDAWYRADGSTLPAVAALAGYNARRCVPADMDEPVKAAEVVILEETSAEAEPAVIPNPDAITAAPNREPAPVEAAAPPFEDTEMLRKMFEPAMPVGDTDRVISHYVLLPTFDWGISDWHLEVIRPYIRKYRPTIGYSLQEAASAKRVTVVGGPGSFSEDVFSALRASGCLVEEIGGDGTDIATQFASM